MSVFFLRSGSRKICFCLTQVYFPWIQENKIFIPYIDAVEWKGRNWILQTFQYEEKIVSRHYTQIRNIEKGGE